MSRSAILALLLGLLTLRWLPELPTSPWLWAFCGLALVCLFSRLRPLGLFLLGFVWACQSAHWAWDDRLASDLEGRTLWLEGRISGLPESSGSTQRFLLTEVSSPRARLPQRLRLSWYGAPELRGGERWRLAVKLKAPRGLSNGAGFDYQAWLLAQRIGATGSVKAGERLATGQGLSAWRDVWRQRLLAVDAEGRAPALVALLLGDGSALSARDWQVLQDTGTLHLMVISGSHISLLAGLLYLLVAGLARWGLWPSRLPWLPWACLLAASGAWGYGLLAGFDVPVRRACVMISVVLFWRWRYEHSSFWTPLLLALLLVLLAEPLAVLSPGFWLSYGAVALLIFGFAGRLGRWSAGRAWLRAQWLMAVGLIPACMALGLPLSPLGMFANLLAVPWVELAVVPLALLGSLTLPVPGLGESLLWLAGALLEVLFQLLTWLAALAPAWQTPAVAPGLLALALLGSLLLLAPAGIPGRWLGLLMLLPAVWPAARLPEYAAAEVRVLDVGQGLAVLIRTPEQTWLYDAGPRTADFDTGERVILPVLRSLGVQRLDVLLLSHADNDHAGGALALAKALRPRQVLSGEPERLPPELQAQPCGLQEWQSAGVQINSWFWPAARESNERSCVLLVQANGQSLLLTGDLPVSGELAWLADHPQTRVDWLLAGHHGSRSASGPRFLRALAAQGVLISRGANNAYGHPHPQVLQNYQALRMAVYDTAELGALWLDLGRSTAPQGVRQQGFFWQKK